MPTIARLIGGAGTGKTTELMRILDGVLQQGIDPLQVGFVSFTKAACVRMFEPWLASVIGSHWMTVELLFRNCGYRASPRRIVDVPRMR